MNLPGSTGGVRDGMAVLVPVLGHRYRSSTGATTPGPTDSGAKHLLDRVASAGIQGNDGNVGRMRGWALPLPSLICSGSR